MSIVTDFEIRGWSILTSRFGGREGLWPNMILRVISIEKNRDVGGGGAKLFGHWWLVSSKNRDRNQIVE